ncbi:MAG TPA: class I SAM-dependent methyltransferase [Solirubrobacteraceae bacterium]|nr:class I SAM-dependent methyltransferase [Solirubrobacteraceae bacterium]
MHTDDDLQRFYADGHERMRLSSPRGRLEYERTLDILKRHLPQPPATVLDIGGGTGPYAHHLAAKGYKVHLLDLVPLHVELALAAEKPEHPLASAVVGDARELPFEDASADVVLLLGPLYHLVERRERLLVLKEAHRVLRPKSLLCATTISRFTSVYEGLFDGFLTDPSFKDIAERDLETGEHNNPTRRRDWFMRGHYYLPQELTTELCEAGFEIEAVVGIEGAAQFLPDLKFWLEDPEQRDLLLEILRHIEGEQPVLGVSSHLHAVGRRSSNVRVGS